MWQAAAAVDVADGAEQRLNTRSNGGQAADKAEKVEQRPIPEAEGAEMQSTVAAKQASEAVEQRVWDAERQISEAAAATAEAAAAADELRLQLEETECHLERRVAEAEAAAMTAAALNRRLLQSEAALAAQVAL